MKFCLYVRALICSTLMFCVFDTLTMGKPPRYYRQPVIPVPSAFTKELLDNALVGFREYKKERKIGRVRVMTQQIDVLAKAQLNQDAVDEQKRWFSREIGPDLPYLYDAIALALDSILRGGADATKARQFLKDLYAGMEPTLDVMVKNIASTKSLASTTPEERQRLLTHLKNKKSLTYGEEAVRDLLIEASLHTGVQRVLANLDEGAAEGAIESLKNRLSQADLVKHRERLKQVAQQIRVGNIARPFDIEALRRDFPALTPLTSYVVKLDFVNKHYEFNKDDQEARNAIANFVEQMASMLEK